MELRGTAACINTRTQRDNWQMSTIYHILNIKYASTHIQYVSPICMTRLYLLLNSMHVRTLRKGHVFMRRRIHTNASARTQRRTHARMHTRAHTHAPIYNGPVCVHTKKVPHHTHTRIIVSTKKLFGVSGDSSRPPLAFVHP